MFGWFKKKDFADEIIEKHNGVLPLNIVNSLPDQYKKLYEHYLQTLNEKHGKGVFTGTEDYESTGLDYIDELIDNYRAINYEQMRIISYNNELIRSCINIIKKGIAKGCKKGNWKIVPVAPDIIENLEIKNELTNFFYLPNKYDTLTTMIKILMEDLLVLDAGAIEIGKNIAGIPKALFRVDGANIVPNMKRNYDLGTNAYFQRNHKTKKKGKPFKFDELIYIQMNPRSYSAYGMSSIENLYRTAELDWRLQENNISNLKKESVPNGIISIGNINDIQLRKFRKYWEQTVKEKKHKIGITNGDAKFTPFNFKNADMEYSSLDDKLGKRVLSMFNIPPFMIGYVDKGTGKLNSSEQKDIFIEETLEPYFATLEEEFNNKVIYQFGAEYTQYHFEFNDLRYKDIKTNAEVNTLYIRHGVYTINEVRKQLGLAAITGGDVPLVPANFRILKEEIEGLDTDEDTKQNLKDEVDKIKSKTIEKFNGEIDENDVDDDLI